MSTTIWDQILTLIEGKVGPHSFSTWFKPTSLKEDRGRALVVRVPAPLYVEWLPRHYSVVLAEALNEAGRPQAQLLFEVEATPPAPAAPAPISALPAAVDSPMCERRLPPALAGPGSPPPAQQSDALVPAEATPQPR